MITIDYQSQTPLWRRVREVSRPIVWMWIGADGRRFGCDVMVTGGHWRATLSVN
jgi:hypothetical protein